MHLGWRRPTEKDRTLKEILYCDLGKSENNVPQDRISTQPRVHELIEDFEGKAV